MYIYKLRSASRHEIHVHSLGISQYTDFFLLREQHSTKDGNIFFRFLVSFPSVKFSSSKSRRREKSRMENSFRSDAARFCVLYATWQIGDDEKYKGGATSYAGYTFYGFYGC